MKLADYLEAPPLDYVGTKSPPITDAERGASFVQILHAERRDTHFCAWNLSHTQGLVGQTQRQHSKWFFDERQKTQGKTNKSEG